MLVGFKKGVKDYKIWDSKDKKIILSRDVTFNEALMMKPMDSQWVESEKTYRISQQVESDATPLPLDKALLFEITPKVTQGGDHVTDEDADIDEDQGSIIGDVQDSCWKNSKNFT